MNQLDEVSRHELQLRFAYNLRSAVGSWGQLLQSRNPISASLICLTTCQSRSALARSTPYFIVSHSPADRPTWLTLKPTGGPYPSPSRKLRTGLASWSAPPIPMPARWNLADLDGMVLGPFAEHGSRSSKRTMQVGLGCRAEPGLFQAPRSSHSTLPRSIMYNEKKINSFAGHGEI